MTINLAPRFITSITQWPYSPSEFDTSGLLPHTTTYSGHSQRGSS